MKFSFSDISPLSYTASDKSAHMNIGSQQRKWQFKRSSRGHLHCQSFWAIVETVCTRGDNDMAPGYCSIISRGKPTIEWRGYAIAVSYNIYSNQKVGGNSLSLQLFPFTNLVCMEVMNWLWIKQTSWLSVILWPKESKHVNLTFLYLMFTTLGAGLSFNNYFQLYVRDDKLKMGKTKINTAFKPFLW